LARRAAGMPDFRVLIVPTGSGSAAFDPNRDDASPGAALEALEGDLVRWRNLTDKVHQPWPTNDKFIPLKETEVVVGQNYLSDPVPPHSISPAAYSVLWPNGSKAIYYCCRFHPEEHGMIVEEN
jgi:hypothetical protein